MVLIRRVHALNANQPTKEFSNEEHQQHRSSVHQGPRQVGRLQATSVVVGSLVSASAFAQSADMPTSVDGAAEFMTSKGGIAIAVCAAITLITLGITAAKLPRKGT